MALIHCPECGGQVSDQATSCPHCGYVLNGSSEHQSTFPQIAPTVIGGVTQNKLGGILLFIPAVILIAAALLVFFFTSILWGIILMVAAVLVTKESIFQYEKKNKVECPHCGRLGMLPVSEGVYKCKYCKKRSARKNGYLHPII